MGYDQLSEQDIRLIELRSLFALLSEYGLTERICKLYQVSDEDLEPLALLEMECRQIAKEREPKTPQR